MGEKTPGDHGTANSRTFVEVFRQNMDRGLRSLSEDTFRALGESGAGTLLQQIVTLALARIIDTTSRTILATAVKEIWKEEQFDAVRSILDNCITQDGSARQAQCLLDKAWTSDEAARALEVLLLFAEVDVLTEKLWVSREWLLVQLRDEVMKWQLRSKLLRLNIIVPSEQRSVRASSRGVLDLSTSASKTLLSAGEEFSVFVTIRNPYDIPVTLYTVETQLPVEFEDIVWRQRRRLELLGEHSKRVRESRGIFFDLWHLSRDRMRNNLRMSAEAKPRIAQAVTAAEASELQEKALKMEASVNIGTITGSGHDVTGVQIDQYQPVSVASASPEHVDAILWRIAAFRRGATPVLLQPGDSVVKQFIFRTNSWLFFRPQAHSLSIEVRYSVEGRDHVAAATFDLVVQAALRATLLGAVLGGVLGGLARALSQADTAHTSPSIRYVSILLAAILSAVAVVSLARKSNAQQIISVEDFWGGLFLGFLIGFFGQQFAVRLLQPGT